MTKIIVQITGPANTKKTTLAAIIARILMQNGVAVSLPPDPQRDQKMDDPLSELLERIRTSDIEVMIMEARA